MKISASIKWLAAAGVVAGLALPSVGTFYALRLQHPRDPFILGLAITSWGLVGIAVVLLGVGIASGIRTIYSIRTARAADWAVHGENLRATIDYLAKIADRETRSFITMEAEEQEYRDQNPGKSGRFQENAVRELTRSEMIEARKNLGDAKARFLEIAPREARRTALADWS
ncbi:MAG: hypothetical protein Q4P24_17315 [Rhodobacterales bacterium]|nr:hypothetical protein [Rhodobacterales bacterium]